MHVIEKCLDYFIQMLVHVTSKDNCIPKNYYEDHNVISFVDLKAQKIYCCEVGYMLDYKDDEYLTKCKFCHFPRYLPLKAESGRYKNV